MAEDWFTGGLTSGLTPEMLLFLYLIGLIIGLILVFGGKLVWRPLMSVVGGFAGSIFGFIIGYTLSGAIGGLIGAPVGAIIGGMIFVAIAEFAVALMSALLAFVLTLMVSGFLILGLIAGAAVFVLSSIYIDKVIGILMAVGGGLISGACLVGLGLNLFLCAITALALMIAGSVIQTMLVKTAREKAIEERRSQVPTCMECGKPLYHDQARNRWFCPDCTPSLMCQPRDRPPVSP
jgi:DNA-directed RNA polymerase subunit RPC12/RpoP